MVIEGADAVTGTAAGTGAGTDPGMGNIDEDIGIAVIGGILTEEMGIGIPTETGATSRLAAVAAVTVTGVTGIDTLATVVAEVVRRASSWLKNL